MIDQAQFEEMYESFNNHNADFILQHYASDVDYPNGMTGERLIGCEAIRSYWKYQWSVVNSQVTPLAFDISATQATIKVHQVIKDLEGKLLSDSVINHIFSFKKGKIVRLEIADRSLEKASDA